MLATSLTAAVLGVDAHLVRVEADTTSGFPRFAMVGLPDSAVKESESRIRAALRNCGYGFKWDRRITVNMAPAGLRKVGASYDLAIAIGLLAADGALPTEHLGGLLLVGELALDGTLRPVAGLLPMLLMARRRGLGGAVVPASQAGEAALVADLRLYPAGTLLDAVDFAANAPPPPPRVASPALETGGPDLADVRGQAAARRGLEIAAAGGHNLLLVGPPGSGKTLLARRLPGLLPPLDPDEALEATAIHSAAGHRLRTAVHRPFRHPHHTISAAALIGGGSWPRPGEASLAHHGVLFLDELPEFSRAALEALREPLEERAITVARVRHTVRLPAHFQLVAAMNPCPCGFQGSARGCRCSPRRVAEYAGRISGPLRDRFDLTVEVPSIPWADLDGPPGEPSAPVHERVCRARGIQARRMGRPGALNANLDPAEVRTHARPDGEGRSLLGAALDHHNLSGRAHDRILRVARTIADLQGEPAVLRSHVAEALHYRVGPA